MEIGHKLKDARADSGLTQETVAEKIGVSRQSVSNWENNRSYPDIASILKLSDLYGVSLDELLKEDEKMKQHIEDNANWLKKYCNLLCDSGFVLAVLSNIFLEKAWITAALVCGLIGLLVAILPRILYVKSFSTSKKMLTAHCIVWTVWIIGNLSGIWMPDSLLRSLLVTAGFWGILIVRYREYRIGERKRAPWVMFAVLVLLEIVSLFALAVSMLTNVGDRHEVNPFSHTYIVEEVLYGSENTQIPTKIRLDSGDGLHLTGEDGTDTDVGDFSYADLTEGEQAEGLRGLWRLIPEDAPNELYKLTVDSNEYVILAHYCNETLHYRIRLTRVDTLFVQVNTLGSTMSTQPTWYRPGEWVEFTPSPSAYAIARKAKATFVFNADPPEELIVHEEYHHGDQVDYYTHTISPDQKGRMKLDLSTRYKGDDPYTSSGQYAVYRIPYKGGEYIFTLRFD